MVHRRVRLPCLLSLCREEWGRILCPVGIVSLMLTVAGALTLIVAGTNYAVDPSGLYRPTAQKQARNLRQRKLALLKGLQRKPVQTLILGSSRVFNLHLSGDRRFPQPVLNFSVTTAKAEDYLAGYRLVRASQPQPPRLVLVGIEHPAFHPRLPAQWEAYTARAFTDELERTGALCCRRGWRWRMLLCATHFRQSLVELERRHKARSGRLKQKFRWQPDGTATWIDLLEGKRNPRLMERQLRTFPRTGLAARSYRRPSPERLRLFEQLLAECETDGVQVIAYIVPAHPRLVELTRSIWQGGVEQSLVRELSELCARHGATFRDWFDPEALGLTDPDFRDVMHPIDEAQRRIADAVAEFVPGGATA
jgi:hypothetical protein